MKHKLLVSLPVLFLAMHLNAQDRESIAIGTALPSASVKMKDIDNKEISLSDAKKSNGLLVMFSCNTCPFVVKNQQRTSSIASYAQQKGYGVVIINSNAGGRDGADSYQAMQEYARNQKYAVPYVVDEAAVVADAFGASRTPEVYVFDKNDKLVYKGAIDDNPGDAGKVKREHLKLALDAAAAGKEVSVKESRSVGCAIKRAS